MFLTRVFHYAQTTRVAELPAPSKEAAVNGETDISADSPADCCLETITCSLTVKVWHQNLTFTIVV